MDLKDFYSQRVNSFKNKSKECNRYANLLSFSRLIIFILIPFSFIGLYNISLLLSILVLVALLFGFGWTIKRHYFFQKEAQVNEYLSTLNQDEIRAVEGDLKGFYDGIEFKPKNHCYASDLDVFGEASLYSLVNRATTWPGRKKVSEWLLNQADVETIAKRQNAIKELRDLVDFRQKLQSFCVKVPELATNPNSLLQWIRETGLIDNPLKLIIAISFLSLLSVAGIVMLILGKGFGLLVLSIIGNILIGFRYKKNIDDTHEKLSKAGTYLKMYSEIIGFISIQNFKSTLLAEYIQCFSKGESSAKSAIKKLAKILDRFDLRFNIMIGVPLNILFSWDIWLLLSLEKWKHKHKDDIKNWFDALGEFEAVSSFANLSFNNADWTFPVINPKDFVFKAKDLGHPLIPIGKRVYNDLNFSGFGNMLLVTGSNMSGKSTFLRTVGINMILAGAGSPICSSSCEIMIRTPFTSMRIADSLEENISTFYAELKRISEIIEAVDKNEPVILLLDEVLRGTNSNDRHKGALALLKQLVSTGAVGIMATHDLELADQELISKGYIKPFFFDVQVDGSELFFDYKLHEGKCTTLNASILMKKMGIRLDYLDT